MKAKEIREISQTELAERIQTEVAKYNQMVLNHKVSPLGNPSQLKAERRNIARMKTILHEMELKNK